jgi:hypothetical protein
MAFCPNTYKSIDFMQRNYKYQSFKKISDGQMIN